MQDQQPEPFEAYSDLFFIEPDKEQIMAFLGQNDFSLTAIEFTIDDPVLEKDLLEKAQMPHDGLIWVVYKYDADPFPSRPHAHRLDSQYKLHLGNGNIYQKKRLVTRMKPKAFLALRAKLEQRNIILPPLELL